MVTLQHALETRRKGWAGTQGTVVDQRYGVSRNIKPKEKIDYIHAGIEGIMAYRKMITESCGEKFNDIYVHEYGVWAPPGFGIDQLLAWLFDRLPEPPPLEKAKTA